MAYKYIDVSRYQGTIDWQAVKNAGIQGAILKTVSTNPSFGGLYIDPTFERNYAECKRLGIPVGVYYYTYALDKGYADKELALLKQALQGKSFELPICIDVEDNSLKPLSADALTDLVVYAVHTLETWGAFAMVYTYTNYKNTELNMTRLSNYALWQADYTGNEPATAGIWQYTSNGSVAGINARVDLNKVYVDYPPIIVGRFNDFTDGIYERTYKPLSPEPVKMVISASTTVALEVIGVRVRERGIAYDIIGDKGYTGIASSGDQVAIIKKASEYGATVEMFTQTDTVPSTPSEPEPEPEPQTENWLIKLIDLLFGWLFK